MAGGKCRAIVRAIFALGLLFLALMPAGAGAQPPAQLSANAVAQIAALQREKASWTPAQRKIESRLLFETKRSLNQPLVAGVPALRRSVKIDPAGNAEVEIEASINDALLRRIEALGGTILGNFPRYNSIHARLPVNRIQALANEGSVRFIREAIPPMLHKTNTSEGDIAHAAAAARAAFGVDGTGVKVGVMSDSAGGARLTQLKNSGDLPTVTVLANPTPNASDEGAAMLEIVYDLAPGAQLYFATAYNTQANFASNILALAAAGCKVIVDDVGYFAEPVFQDGIVAQAVDTVAASGVAYFSSAGNSGNLNDGTAGVWEGDFVGIAAPPVIGGTAHDFGGGTNHITITQDSPFLFTLQWSDPQGGSGNDYDLYLLDPTLSGIYDASLTRQTGSQNPYESISSSGYNDLGNKLVIIKHSGSDRYLHLNAHRGRLGGATAGQTWGHAAANGAFGVAAVSALTAGGPGGVFNGTESVETFSSDGPRRVFFDASGTPYTPGNFSSTGGQLRLKPDLTAADGVACATPGFNPFYGTSAAAPHAAAIAALLISQGYATTPARIRRMFEHTALDIEASGIDRDSGVGIIMADASLAGVLAALSTVDAHSNPQGNIVLPDWNTTESLKMSVLKFKITDPGGDGVPTLIDRLIVPITGTAGNAANDIAWAELYNDTAATRTALAASITNSQIVFGAPPNGDGDAQLDTVADNASVEYTVNIYLNESLLGAYDQTYIFDINETNIGVDGDDSSLMAADSGAVAPVTGTLFITELSVSVTPDTWAIGPVGLGQAAESGTFTLQNGGNVAADFLIKASDGDGGWSLAGAPGQDAFKVESDRNDDGSYEMVLTTAEQTFAANVAASGEETLGLKYSAPTSDTWSADVNQNFTVTLKASRHVP